MNKTCSIFSQMLQLFSRIEFQRAVSKHKADRHARGFTCWGQFIAMLFCQVGQAHSLREICGGLAACEGKLRHLGVPKAPKRSTLAYANEHRPWELYQEVFNHLYQRCRAVVEPRKRFRFRNPLVSIDASLIDLCSTVFDWAKFRRYKGAAKLHLVLDHNGCLPRFAVITEGKAPEVVVARTLEFEPGTILVMDKGYVDYRWYQKLTDNGVFFVTRLRHDVYYKVVENRQVPLKRNVLKDQIIQLGSHWYRQESLLRRIEIRVPEWDRELVLLTNNLEFGSTTISSIYRERWKIESFFRSLKQTLRIKTFVGTSANALKIQIWTALIAILLFKYLQLQSSFGWSLSNLVAMLRQQLFIYRDIWTWLNHPFDPPPALEQAGFQMELLLST
jgi:hypothetical protein